MHNILERVPYKAAAMLIRETALKYGKEAATKVLDELFNNSPILLLHEGGEVNGTNKDGSSSTPHNDDCGGAEHLCRGSKDPAGGRESRNGKGGDSRLAEGAQVFALPTRKQRDGISRRLVELELEEHKLDLTAFQTAYSTIHKRVTEVKDEGRLMTLVNWSGTSAVMGSLELARAATLAKEELRDILKRMAAGAIVNSDEE